MLLRAIGVKSLSDMDKFDPASELVSCTSRWTWVYSPLVEGWQDFRGICIGLEQLTCVMQIGHRGTSAFPIIDEVFKHSNSRKTEMRVFLERISNHSMDSFSMVISNDAISRMHHLTQNEMLVPRLASLATGQPGKY